jgi:hypothetical protein
MSISLLNCVQFRIPTRCRANLRLSPEQFDQYLRNAKGTDKELVKKIQACRSVEELKNYMTRSWLYYTWDYVNLDDKVASKINQSLEFR